MADIYHIAPRGEWEAAAAAGSYSPRSLEHEGFIHCSKPWQILDVANTRYHGRKDLVLLCIDPARVVPEVRNEDCYDSGERFPHIYGPLESSAVRRVIDFPCDDRGTFALPRELG